jgi:Domain of unknown function (DUF4276)
LTRVYVVVEGATEEAFVANILAQSLWPRNVYLTPIILGSPGHKGGNPSYARVKRDVVTQLKQDWAAYCSTMIDFYGLGAGFPGTPPPLSLSSYGKVRRIEQAFKVDVVESLPDIRADARFIPYLQLHEYEGLLFSDPPTLASGIGQQHLAAHFQTIRSAFPTPEDIDDSPNTAPSKRITDAYAAYSKPIDGLRAAQAIGVDRIRLECPHFREWLEQLQALADG